MKKFKQRTKKENIRIILNILGVLLLLVGIGLAIHYGISYYQDYKEDQQQQEEIDEFMDNFDETDTITTDEEEIASTEEDTSNSSISYDIIGVLEISSINVKVGLYSTDSEKNSVNYSVQILAPYSYPDEDGQTIIAGHSGTGVHAYFKNLDKLMVGDEVNIYYKGKTYSYELAYVDQQAKTGELKISRSSIYTLVLITCTRNNSTAQSIYYFVDSK